MNKCIVCLLLFCFLTSAPACGVQAREKVVLAAASWQPYISTAEGGGAQGLYADLLRELFENRMGFELVFLEVPWKRAQLSVKSGLADMLVTVATAERLEYAIAAGEPLIQIVLHVYTYTDHPRKADIDAITSGEDIKKLQLRPVTNIGNGWHETQIDNHGITTFYVANEENAFQMLAAKRADISIEPRVAGNYLINKLGLEDKVVVTDARFGPLQMDLLVGKASPLADRMDDINAELTSMIKSGVVAKIVAGYM